MTPEERLAKLQKLKELKDLKAQSQGMVAAQPQKTPDASRSFGMGLTDPIYGAGQFVPRVLEQVTSLGGNFPNPVSDLYGKSAARVDADVQAREKAYTDAGGNQGGIDWWRMGGNIASPPNYVMPTGSASTILGQMGKGALSGLGFSTMQPVQDTQNYWDEKGGQMLTGTLSGGAVPAVTGTLSKAFQPIVTKGTDLLKKEGVSLTPGQSMGGLTKWTEDKLTSVPFLGDMIKKSQSRGIEDLNRAAYARALKPIGEKLPNDVALGRDAVAYINQKLSDKYDNLLPSLGGQVDNQFSTDISTLKNMVANDLTMNPAEQDKFVKILTNTIDRRVAPGGGYTGQAVKEIESELGNLSAKFGQGDVSQRALANALKETQQTLRDMVERTNPQYAKELSSINKGYANFKRIQQAATKKGSQDLEAGVFTPAELQQAVKMLDKSKDRSAFAKGNALMQDLSEAAVKRLPNSIPNSGTADRLLMAGIAPALFGLGGTGASYVDPERAPLYLGLAAATLPYTRLGGAAYTKTIPAGSELIARGLRNLGPLLGGPAGLQLLNQPRDNMAPQ